MASCNSKWDLWLDRRFYLGNASSSLVPTFEFVLYESMRRLTIRPSSKQNPPYSAGDSRVFTLGQRVLELGEP